MTGPDVLLGVGSAGPTHLPPPASVRFAAFSDFDETYLAHAATSEQRSHLTALEQFLLDAGERHQLLFGWVTGSSLASVQKKMERCGARVLPHFVASSLGTELTFFRNGFPEPDQRWQEQLEASGFSKAKVERIVERLAGNRVTLFPQNNGNSTEFMENYYFRTLGDQRRDAEALDRVRDLAKEENLGLNISRCNPATGDPADCFDVDFTPPTCGKRNVVQHICSRFGVDPQHTFAFGDSGNDLEMLRAVRHGTLVGNCTPEARANFPRVSEHDYAQAILTSFRHHLGH
ncbi:HAD-IIB family hydrolase [Streptomyces anatolicus]|uniref:HAD-IIB family hydrolase n=1 Tax=Streptomyces anatolicus TaxID=2675858 RepID=UPI0027E167F1|nr:HAD-IIB family hydrolase [Streptomyces anatolicus]